MDSATLFDKETKLRELIKKCDSIVVAYSGGVDSTLVAKIAHQELGAKSLMVIADSPSLPRHELDGALALAHDHGFNIQVIKTEEMDHPDYLANPHNRCYFCKHELYSKLSHIREQLGFKVIANGDHWSDLRDHRPGQQAAQEKRVQSILTQAKLTKEEIRILAKQLGLSNHDKPASPCLSSRIPTGSPVTVEKLQQIEKCEFYLKKQFQISDLRVRHLNKTAKIETDSIYFKKIIEHRDEINQMFKRWGFEKCYLDLQPFKSGSFQKSHKIDKKMFKI